MISPLSFREECAGVKTYLFECLLLSLLGVHPEMAFRNPVVIVEFLEEAPSCSPAAVLSSVLDDWAPFALILASTGYFLPVSFGFSS